MSSSVTAISSFRSFRLGVQGWTFGLLFFGCWFLRVLNRLHPGGDLLAGPAVVVVQVNYYAA
jgi:hypothetical protein